MPYIDRGSIKNFKMLLGDYLTSKHGKNINKPFTCLNPEHEDRHPSMSYSSKYNICKCFACGASYDIFDLIGLDYGVTSFSEKLEIADKLYPNISNIVFKKFDVIEDESNLIDFTNYYKKCINKISNTDYLNNRKIDIDLLKKYNVGYDDKREMVVFPINKNCYFARSVNSNQKLKSRGTSYLWNEKLLENSDSKTLIYVTESIIDSLSLETIDPDIKTVALNGLPNYKRLLKVIDGKKFVGNIVLAFDNDITGKTYQDIVKEELKKRKINSFSTSIIFTMDVKDLNEALVKDKEAFIRNYNYFNQNFKMIIDKMLNKESDLEL
jgi:DNA primase